MAGTHGTKETREALIALVALGAFVAARAKDGLQINDAVALGTALVADPVFKAKVLAGVEGSDKLLLEVKELDVADYLDIAKVIPELIAEIKA